MTAPRPLVAGLLLAMFVGAPAAAQVQPGATQGAFDAWDTDHNGVLSRTEFRDGWQAMVERNVRAQLRSQFDRLDRNRDGALDVAEYANLSLVRQAGKAAPALDAFDANDDRRLQFDEYIASVRTLAAVAGKPGAVKP